MQPDSVELRLFDPTKIIVWNINGPQNQVAEIYRLKIRAGDEQSVSFIINIIYKYKARYIKIKWMIEIIN